MRGKKPKFWLLQMMLCTAGNDQLWWLRKVWKGSWWCLLTVNFLSSWEIQKQTSAMSGTEEFVCDSYALSARKVIIEFVCRNWSTAVFCGFDKFLMPVSMWMHLESSTVHHKSFSKRKLAVKKWKITFFHVVVWNLFHVSHIHALFIVGSSLFLPGTWRRGSSQFLINDSGKGKSSGSHLLLLLFNISWQMSRKQI